LQNELEKAIIKRRKKLNRISRDTPE
jgi:hypothetical protein